jgi:hypothetical protein
MELALAKTEAHTGRALIVASRQLLLIIALAYAIAYLVPACISFASQQAEEPRASAVPDSDFRLSAKLLCESAPPRLRARSACNVPK